jgi:hypothetical protein
LCGRLLKKNKKRQVVNPTSKSPAIISKSQFITLQVKACKANGYSCKEKRWKTYKRRMGF